MSSLCWIALAFAQPLSRGINVVPERSAATSALAKDLIPVVEPGGHAGSINDLAVHSATNTVVTVGSDGAIRQWSLQTGELRRSTYIPTEQTGSGLRVAAISPDGAMIAAAGGPFATYLFDRAYGSLVARNPNGLGSVVDLAWQGNRRLLASPVQGGTLRYVGSKLAGSDQPISRFEMGLTRVRDGGNGAFFTCSPSGSVRRHQANGYVVARSKGDGGQCYSFDVSDDGKLVLAVEGGSRTVRLLDARTMAEEATLTSKMEVLQARFAPSGHVLALTGGGDQREWRKYVVEEGKWKAKNIAEKRLISQFVPTGDGRVVTSNGYDLALEGPGTNWTVPRAITLQDIAPIWFQGLKCHEIGAYTGDTEEYCGTGEGRVDVALPTIEVGPDGSSVVYRLEGEGLASTFAAFALREGSLEQGEPALITGNDWFGDRFKRQFGVTLGADFSALSPPEIDYILKSAKQSGFHPTEDGKSVEIAGKKVPLELLEAPIGVLDLPGVDDKVVLTYKRLWRIRADGVVTWRTNTPGTMGSANVSDDGRFLVAGMGDGTLRWYEATSGAEKLAYFPHADGRRWVAWTPEGYYAASLGGEDLLAYKQNRGPDKTPNVFPASRFRATLYRPDKVAAALGGTATLAPSSVRLPPIVTLLSPEDGAEPAAGNVVLALSGRSPSGQIIREVQTYVDGRPVQAVIEQSGDARNVNDRRFALTVPILAGQRVISVRIATADQESDAVHLRLGRTGDPQPPALRVLGVGVGDYARLTGRRDLAYPPKDATDIVDRFKKANGALFSSVETRTLVDGAATREAILDGLEWLDDKTATTDVAVVVLAGHGFDDGKGGEFHFAPVEGDPAAIEETMVSGAQLLERLGAIDGKVLMFLDACHGASAGAGGIEGTLLDATSIGLRRSATPVRDDTRRFVNELADAGTGVVVLAAAESGQVAWESKDWGNGAFTKAVVEGLGGEADPAKTGRVTVESLYGYVRSRVGTLTGRQQTPVLLRPVAVPDFPLAVVGQ